MSFASTSPVNQPSDDKKTVFYFPHIYDTPAAIFSKPEHPQLGPFQEFSEVLAKKNADSGVEDFAFFNYFSTVGVGAVSADPCSYDVLMSRLEALRAQDPHGHPIDYAADLQRRLDALSKPISGGGHEGAKVSDERRRNLLSDTRPFASVVSVSPPPAPDVDSEAVIG